MPYATVTVKYVRALSFISWLHTGIPPTPDMPQRRSTRGSPAGTRIPDVFSTAVYNSAVTNLNRSPQSSSPHDARTSRARRRLALGETTSPTSANDESRARSLRAGGGARRTRIAEGLDEDDSNDQLDPETSLSTLAASDQPILQ